MTQPNPDDAKAAAEKAAAEKAAADKAAAEKAAAGKAMADTLAQLEVVVFTHHDPILRRSRRAVGVVVDVDDQGVTVRPLAHHDIRVPLADAQRYDDATDVDEV